MSKLNQELGNTSKDSASFEDKTNLLNNLQATNQLLRRQAITIVLFSVIALGLMDLSQTQWDKDQAIYSKIAVLEKLGDATNLKLYIEQNYYQIESALMHEIDTDALYFKLEKNEYVDRTPIVEAISELKKQRKGIGGISESTVSILGVNIPIGSWFYFVPLIILILFHNFAETAYYRRQLLNKVTAEFEAWKQGPYLSGYRDDPRTDVASKYFGLVSTLIATGFLLLPVLTSFLFIASSYQLTIDYGRASRDSILGLNWACLLVTLLDVTVVLHQENILYFRALVGSFAGKGRKQSKKTLGFWRGTMWFAIPLVVFLLHYFTELKYDTRHGIVPFYLLTATAMAAVLPISLWLLQIRPNSDVIHAMLFIGVVITLFWISIPPLIWLDFVAYTHADPTEMVQLSIAVSIGAVILSILYVRFIRGQSGTGV